MQFNPADFGGPTWGELEYEELCYQFKSSEELLKAVLTPQNTQDAQHSSTANTNQRILAAKHKLLMAE